MMQLGIFMSLIILVMSQTRRYDNYQVFRVVPKTVQQNNILLKMSEISGYSFWDGPHFVNNSADVMVSPNKLHEFKQLMNVSEIVYDLHINNVQDLMESENLSHNKLIRAGFDWKNYHTLEEIYDWLDTLAKAYPDKVQIVVAGKTYEGRDIKGVKVSFKEGNSGIFIEGNIHAREWITSATVTFILNELLTSQETEVRELAEKNDWYIFPVFNPDGFVYTHNKDRLWRKTRKPYSRLCYGSDPNRNWGYKWNQGGASSFPCAETYAGTAAFSDVETQSMSEYITSIADKFYAYIAFHSYSQLLLFPYGHTTTHLDNHDELKAIGLKTIDALSKRYGTKYITGNIAETIYIASGSSMDWVKANFRTRISYTYELRDKGNYGFLLPANQIIPTGQETLDSLIALFKQAEAYGIPQR
ncbi:zinc carboxypeptidase-like [Microplitis mediator]|uniref:zinc carboxypeptidase-like n=1 Tax=Microplitis mediator TaxID=375433 RepID=UPI002557A40D|nr:zinc carboxypeptidase-like [Microplitis mediator]